MTSFNTSSQIGIRKQQANTPVKVKTNKSIQKTTDANVSGQGRIAVIDNFETKLDLDFDGIKDDITHGEIVSALTCGTNNIHINNNGNESYSDDLAEVRKKVENGEKISAVNISMGNEGGYGFLSNYSDEEVTPANLRDKAPTIISNMRKETENLPQHRVELQSDLTSLNAKLNTVPSDSQEAKDTQNKINDINKELMSMNIIEDTVKTYDEINKLDKLGVPVVIASGNLSSPNQAVNLLTLNEKAITVGATTAEPINGDKHYPAEYAFNNSLVDISLKGDYKTSSLPDTLSQKFSFKGKTDYFKSDEGYVSGTSFSTPNATKFTAQLKEKGLSNADINTTFKVLDVTAEQKNLDSNFLVNHAINNYF